jgi:hypothetical protein
VNVLFFGDIVGPEATAYVADCVPRLRRDFAVDLVIANAENCAPSGLGMTVALVERLLASGVDVITGGNHSWEGTESGDVLSHPSVLRPLNVADGAPGKGLLVLELAVGPVTVVNLADARALESAAAVAGNVLPPYPCWLASERRGSVIVDFHGDHVIEKQIFAYAVDGEAAAVVGTHSHEPTLPLHILPGGTALVTDVGMTGPLGGVQGFAHGNFVSGLKQKGNYFAPPLPGPVRGPISVGAVVLEVEGGRTRRIDRLDRTGRRSFMSVGAGPAERP